MRLSSIIKAVEDTVVGSASRVARATSNLFEELHIEATARHMANVERRAEREMVLRDCREAVRATYELAKAREGVVRTETAGEN
jgi:predicted RNA binding protein with dsRBD fold (UPF0201 family)